MAGAKSKATKAAETDSGVNPKVEKAAGELRKQGATAAIISHTLDINYREAQALVVAWDKKHGAPKEIVRLADGIKLAGYTVKDGRDPKAVKLAAKTKKALQPAAKPADKPVAHPAATE